MGISSGGHASLIGTTFAGYEVLALIGRGSVGTVYLARDIALNRQVALKVLLGSLARNPEAVDSFRMEAMAAAPLRHPGVVRIYSAGVERGTPYIVMEYVAGGALDRFLRRNERLSWQNAFYVARQVADALACAHRHGIIHRDVKPANIMLDREGRVHLTDFGIANVTAGAENQPASRGFAGTLHYMSPEQCAGGDVGAATDLYSLGVTLYQMMTGQLPFDADSPVALIKKITTDPVPKVSKLLPDVPDDVARLVTHLLQKEPKERPADAASVCESIGRLLAENGGRSVLPDALAFFIKDQSRVTPVNGLPSRNPVRQPKTPVWEASPTASRGKRYCRAWKRAAVCCALACLVLGGWVCTKRQSGASSAPVIEAAVFEDMGAGSVLMRLPLDGYRFTEPQWVGTEPVVIAQANGIEGTLTSGAWGLLAVHPATKRCWSLRFPASPGTNAAYWHQRRAARRQHAIPPVPADSPLAEAALIWDPELPTGPEGQHIAVFGQKWSEAAPGQAMLCRLPAHAWQRSGSVPWRDEGVGHVVPKPDGFTVCLVLEDPLHQTNYLVERDTRWEPPDRVGPRLTTLGGRIVPESVRYSPNGSMIAYLREREQGRKELWVVSVENPARGTLAALGEIEDQFAFSPDGEQLAVAVRCDEAEPELRLVGVRNGAVQARLGPGCVGANPWHSSGDYLVAQAGKQLWAIETRTPHRRVALTRVEPGFWGGAAVSYDSEWAAAVVDAPMPTLVFVRLSEVKFDRFVL